MTDLGDVVALKSGHRNAGDVVQTYLRRKLSVIAINLFENFLRVIDEIDFVDSQHNVANTEKRDQETVTSRLGKNTLPCINQNDCEIGS